MKVQFEIGTIAEQGRTCLKQPNFNVENWGSSLIFLSQSISNPFDFDKGIFAWDFMVDRIFKKKIQHKAPIFLSAL